MLEASLSGVLKFVLVVLLIYFGFKIIIRFFGPLILKYFMRKMGEKFEQQFGQQFGNQFGGAASKKSKSNPTETLGHASVLNPILPLVLLICIPLAFAFALASKNKSPATVLIVVSSI